MDLLIELEFNMGLAKGQQENLIIQQNKRVAWVLYSTISAHSCSMHDLKQVICVFLFKFSLLEYSVKIVG